MLALLLNMPQGAEEWSRWAFHHRASHDLIRQAIKVQLGINLPDYVLDPIPGNAVQNFLENNHSAHIDMNGVLNRPSVDLEDVDFEKENELRAWIYMHWQEHNVVENTLKIGS
jgi:hypothetical protein